jgi:hypothetical protein
MGKPYVCVLIHIQTVVEFQIRIESEPLANIPVHNVKPQPFNANITNTPMWFHVRTYDFVQEGVFSPSKYVRAPSSAIHALLVLRHILILNAVVSSDSTRPPPHRNRLLK